MRQIKWDKQATLQFDAAMHYIRNDSPANAERLKKQLLEKISQLAINAEIYTLDKYKKGNQGEYRAFELYRYRISYLVKEKEIIITRIRHTSQAPKKY